MLKKKIILPYLILGAFFLNILYSCDSFLDVVPDDRTEIDSPTKVKELLVSAYPQWGYEMMGELMSDNVTDNGPRFSAYNRLVEESYKWGIPTLTTQDSPYALWNDSYKAIAATNYVLEYINNTGDASLNPQKGEALLCRAYAHFLLVNMFCQHYNPETSSTDLGIPYVSETNVDITDIPARETVEEVYRKINEDIEAGLPLIDDNSYASNVIKYHFNKKAAHAFAARFNLYYGNYDNTIKYATVALGNDPASVLRVFSDYQSVTSTEDIAKLYIRPALDCNLLLTPAHSYWPLTYQYAEICRYAHNTLKSRETFRGEAPWGSSSNFIPANILYGANETIFFPKYIILWEVTDVVAQTGFAHIVSTSFTTDETLLCRAEAYVLKKDYTNATKDLEIWYNSHTQNQPPALTEARIEDFYSKTTASYLKPELNPKFATPIESGKQTSFIHCVLHFRRCETMHQGLRWFDIKRYGLEVVHPIDGENDLVLKSDDLRKAVQIPDAVISAGLVPNPR